jgi:hypothetical protein
MHVVIKERITKSMALLVVQVGQLSYCTIQHRI